MHGRLLGCQVKLEALTAHEFTRTFQGYQAAYSWV